MGGPTLDTCDILIPHSVGSTVNAESLYPVVICKNLIAAIAWYGECARTHTRTKEFERDLTLCCCCCCCWNLWAHMGAMFSLPLRTHSLCTVIVRGDVADSPHHPSCRLHESHTHSHTRAHTHLFSHFSRFSLSDTCIYIAPIYSVHHVSNALVNVTRWRLRFSMCESSTHLFGNLMKQNPLCWLNTFALDIPDIYISLCGHRGAGLLWGLHVGGWLRAGSFCKLARPPARAPARVLQACVKPLTQTEGFYQFASGQIVVWGWTGLINGTRFGRGRRRNM